MRKRRCFYIGTETEKDIKRVAKSRESSENAIVREALSKFFKEVKE